MGRRKTPIKFVQFHLRIPEGFAKIVTDNMDIMGYPSMNELVRELLRKWIKENVGVYG